VSKASKEISTMTAPDSLPLHALTEDNLASASPDLLRQMVKAFADAVMSADADALCGAEYGQVSDERVNHRNGYRPREWDTRAGTVELAIPKPGSLRSDLVSGFVRPVRGR
jgi:transposase-like protein